ncbi:hypothetical protein BDR05DRAFT_159123 [Suillus weaverae]|nr:hypothetical protein BDR05DRAFT_159123 [Suillus weaverae]
MNGKDLGISAIGAKRQQQLDAVLHEISGLETIMDGVRNLHQQLVDKKEKITRSIAQEACIGSLVYSKRSPSPKFSLLSPGILLPRISPLGTRLLVVRPKPRCSHAVSQNMPMVEGCCRGHAHFVV